MELTVDQLTCMACFHCKRFCPEEAIVPDPANGKCLILQEKCTLCLRCVSHCTMGVIEVIRGKNDAVRS